MTSKELTTAGTLLMIEFGAFITLSLALVQMGLPGFDLVFAGLLLFNLATAWFMARAARAQGKSAILYGVLSIVPAGALFVFFRLWNCERYKDWA